MANNYGVNELKEKCMDIIKYGITIEDVLFIAFQLNIICLNWRISALNSVSIISKKYSKKSEAFRKMDENSLKNYLAKVSEYVFK